MIKVIATWIFVLSMLGVIALVAYQEVSLESSRRENLNQRIADFERKLDALDARVRIRDAIEAAREHQTGRTP